MAETLTTASLPGGEVVLAGRRIARVGFGTMQLPRLGNVNAGRAVLRRARERPRRSIFSSRTSPPEVLSSARNSSLRSTRWSFED